MLDHICSSSEARVRTIWAPGLGPGSAWRGLAHKIKAVEYTERDRSRALSTLWYLSPALCKLYEGDQINADPDRSQSRHNNLTWQRYRVLFVRVLLYLHWLQNPRNSTAEDFITITSTKCWCWSRAVVWFMLVLGPASGSGNGWYDSNPVYFIFWCLTRLL